MFIDKDCETAFLHQKIYFALKETDSQKENWTD